MLRPGTNLQFIWLPHERQTPGTG